MDTEVALTHADAVPGTPVLTRSGTEIGTLEQVLEIPGSGVFDGIVITTDWGLRFIGAAHVFRITVRNIRCELDDAEASRLPPPDGTAVYRVSALDEIGDALQERLGRMFHRPYWPGN